jgi:hypothetical protein
LTLNDDFVTRVDELAQEARQAYGGLMVVGRPNTEDEKATMKQLQRLILRLSQASQIASIVTGNSQPRGAAAAPELKAELEAAPDPDLKKTIASEATKLTAVFMEKQTDISLMESRSGSFLQRMIRIYHDELDV